ncbi:hypothetical protein EG328_011633 [Venturia inaequalis]|uniref:histidine kinase n=1 Tax=Venturia inaequalis TaxID=5025 RepID=A0A8H3U4M8_VENIN|nr:hypothetical protein EG328_011633 [Venturia inaequalis]
MTMQSDRPLNSTWNASLIIASIAISFLGAFTSTQLMCHARMSVRFSGVLIWSLLGSMIFGFCSIWSLHMVAMLAFEFDLLVEVDAAWTVLSSLLAVGFTFVALATDLLWDRYQERRKGPRRRTRRSSHAPSHSISQTAKDDSPNSAAPLLRENDTEDEEDADTSPAAEMESVTVAQTMGYAQSSYRSPSVSSAGRSGPSKPPNGLIPPRMPLNEEEAAGNTANPAESRTRTSSEYSLYGHTTNSSTSLGLGSAMGLIYRRSSQPAKNAFIATATLLYHGCTPRNLVKGFIWSLAVTGMHYAGILGLQIPYGYVRFDPVLVALSAVISWAVCTVAILLMGSMETHLPQQILFSVIAAAGVAAMHFTGMSATRFYSTSPPTEIRGYPPALSNAVVAIAFVTCIAANVLLAHSATMSRNKLADLVVTRKELWKTIALKENAEAAARARSDFIASASHEIRTPLHHLQGYSDLLAQTELTEEGRSLLTSIQRATKTLSLITNNVLDWSKFERDSESAYRPAAVDVRAICESIIVLLPNLDEESRVQLFVVVAPDVPKTLFMDETYIHRILMNLLSNALKFTRTGYILLSLQLSDDNLVAIVQDTGCGLDPAFIPDMWTPFKQGEVRGSARGTGLGLSIIKQLLARMKGTIDVESRYMHAEDIGPELAGTTFTVRIPLQSTMIRPPTPVSQDRPRIAILSRSMTRATASLKECWQSFGYTAEILSDVATLVRGGPWNYVWAELEYLNENTNQFNQLLRSKNLLILVPYDTQDSLESLPTLISAPNFVMLPKPLIWHTFDRRITASKHRRQSTAPSQALRFAPEIEVINENEGASEAKISKEEEAPKAKQTVLIVEDNSINQKLAKKMLVSLGYAVLSAMDGQEGVEAMLKHDSLVDVVLMDQSMPRKDGVTATREIRELEQAGKLSRRTPIIAVTAVVNTESKRLFEEAGADDFLAKPLSLDRLRDTLTLYSI